MDLVEAMQVLQELPAWWQRQVGADQQDRTSLARFQEAQRVAETPASYRGLTAGQGHEFAALALSLFDADFQLQASREGLEWLPYEILTNVADVVPGALRGLYVDFLERDLGWGSNSLFRQADPDTRDRLLALIESDTGAYSLSDMLCAFAWIGDAVVQEQFASWRSNPPAWSASFAQPVHTCTLEAGWELTADGHRRDLYWQESYDLVPAQRLPPEQLPGPVSVAAQQEETCGWCGRALMTLFALDLRDPRLAFLGIRGEHLRLPLCLNCSLQYARGPYRVFMDIDGHSLARWSPVNGPRPKEIKLTHEYGSGYIPPFPPQPVALGAARPTPYERAGSHLGGCAEWTESSSDYPRCPECERWMMFLGQYELRMPEIPFLEGYLATFVCLPCGKATIGHHVP